VFDDFIVQKTNNYTKKFAFSLGLIYVTINQKPVSLFSCSFKTKI